MDKDFKELLMKKIKEGKSISGKKKEAAMSVLGELKDMMSSKMAEDLKEIDPKEMKKVTVASDSKEGLKAGLEKAEEILEKSPEEEMGESEEDMDSEKDMDSEEDMDSEDMEKYHEEYGKDMKQEGDEYAEDDMSMEEIEELLKKMKA